MGEDKGNDLIIKCWKSGKEGLNAKPVRTWLEELDDQSYNQLDKLLMVLRSEKKNISLPYSRHLGEGLHELRDSRKSGPGYRLYYCWQNEMVVILLVGGDKDSQDTDIQTARNRMQDKE